MQVQRHIPLAALSTFGIGGDAAYFVEASSDEDVVEAYAFARAKDIPVVILGGGSNILVCDSGIDGLVVRMATKGYDVIAEKGDDVVVKVAAGEDFDGFVQTAVKNHWWGLENMSFIPGTVGAVPLQNVGAYGQEASDVLERVDVWDRHTSTALSLENSACEFAYRSSLFNRRERGRYVVLHVVFRLSKKSSPNLDFKIVREHFYPPCRGRKDQAKRVIGSILAAAGLGSPNSRAPEIAEIRDCIISIRTDGRLPDYRQNGNAGSFFKNTMLSDEAHASLLARAEGTLLDDTVDRLKNPAHRYVGSDGIKIPSGLLIDGCGLKGLRVGGATLHSRNSVILMNESGNATAADVLTLMRRIRATVFAKTGVVLNPEPQFLGFPEWELRDWMSLDDTG